MLIQMVLNVSIFSYNNEKHIHGELLLECYVFNGCAYMCTFDATGLRYTSVIICHGSTCYPWFKFYLPFVLGYDNV